MANLHPYQRAHDANNYMTLDMFSTNNYGYKDLPNNLYHIKLIKMIIILQDR